MSHPDSQRRAHPGSPDEHRHHSHGGDHGDEPRDALRFAVLTTSDAGAAGERDDASGDAVVALLEAAGFHRVERALVPDERDRISALLRDWADGGTVDLVITTGGTGLGPRDVTPEATADVIDIVVPGIPEAMRSLTLENTHAAMLSRATAGVRGRTLIVNLPGSPRGVRETLAVILPVLPHAVDILWNRRESGHPTDGLSRDQRA